MTEQPACKESGLTSFRDGYPIKQVKGKNIYLHRVALEERLGRPIKQGLLALHTCHNRWCVEGEHLYEGTHRDNMEDMKQSGRSKNCGTRKLTSEQVEEIRTRLAANETGSALAREFGVHKAQVSRIKNRKSHS